MKYRVVQKGNKFYPQVKEKIFWKGVLENYDDTFCLWSTEDCHHYSSYVKAYKVFIEYKKYKSSLLGKKTMVFDDVSSEHLYGLIKVGLVKKDKKEIDIYDSKNKRSKRSKRGTEK